MSFGSEILSAKSPIKQPGRRNRERAREERACVSYGLKETSPWFGPDQYTIFCHWTPETTAWSPSIKEQRLSLIINEEDYDTGAQEAKHTVCDVLFPSLSRRGLLQTLLFLYTTSCFCAVAVNFPEIFVGMSFSRPENEILWRCFKCKIREAYDRRVFTPIIACFGFKNDYQLDKFWSLSLK